jgi:hypothetical protein
MIFFSESLASLRMRMMGSNGASGLKRTSLSRYKNYLRKHVRFLDIHPQWITIYLGKGVCACLGHD